ncbi:hypothetical protein [Methyloversatilis thermotolerans]|uniref:hypothetical protein n=1 Tax=Methyloversatilis thermotolerans TaxID=1346290 RepID=UPI00036BFEA9|nr:hypothetical protein [Methyloversatilis thermotolerans]
MKTLTIIANSLDARMLRDVLALEGLHVKLVRARGDARRHGAVVLQIAEAELERGQALLAQWLVEHPSAAPPGPTGDA